MAGAPKRLNCVAWEFKRADSESEDQDQPHTDPTPSCSADAVDDDNEGEVASRLPHEHEELSLTRQPSRCPSPPLPARPLPPTARVSFSHYFQPRGAGEPFPNTTGTFSAPSSRCDGSPEWLEIADPASGTISVADALILAARIEELEDEDGDGDGDGDEDENEDEGEGEGEGEGGHDAGLIAEQGQGNDAGEHGPTSGRERGESDVPEVVVFRVRGETLPKEKSEKKK